MLTDPRHQLPNGADRWGPGIKEMDSVEEDYFNGDEDEVPAEPLPVEEDPNAEKLFELKRRRSEDDDGDDELLQIAQRSPQSKGMYLNFCDAHIQADDNSNGAKPSGSPPTASPPSERLLREKRPRDSDEQEDEMDRLTRSSKRAVGPTEKRKPSSRGSLNGGRKIAISLGKK